MNFVFSIIGAGIILSSFFAENGPCISLLPFWKGGVNSCFSELPLGYIWKILVILIVTAWLFLNGVDIRFRKNEN